MGDKPDLMVFDKECPFGPYPDGIQPRGLYALLRGSNFTTGGGGTLKPPPNGLHLCSFQYCTFYQRTFLSRNPPGSPTNVYGFNILLTATYFSFNLFETSIGNIYHTQWTDFEHPRLEADLSVLAGPFTDAQIVLWPNLPGDDLPPSWDGGALFGVSQSEGYFSEEFGPTQENRFTRSSSHRDGTNIHVIGDI